MLPRQPSFDSFFSIKRPYFNFYLLQYFITHNLAIFYQCNPGFLVTNFRKKYEFKVTNLGPSFNSDYFSQNFMARRFFFAP